MNALVADVGATKVRIGFWKALTDPEPHLLNVARFETSRFQSFSELITTYLKDHDNPHWDALAIGVAGPVRNGVQASMTNLDWIIQSEELSQQFGQKPVFLLNDLAAHGHSLSLMKDRDLFCLQKGEVKAGNQALIAVGTGLGEALIIRDSSICLVSPSEGGHCTFSPFDELELALYQFLTPRYSDHLSWERVLSGKFGFKNLFEFFWNQNLKDTSHFSKPFEDDWGPWVCSEANRGNPIAIQTLECFFKLYGREAGNLALKGLAVGGVFLAGGIARKLVSELSQSQFVFAFSQKGRMSALLKDIPIFVILDPDAPLKGLGQYCLQKFKEK